MIVNKAHKIRPYPNNKQANYFAKACGDHISPVCTKAKIVEARIVQGLL